MTEGTGVYLQVHVSGLPSVCDDADVEIALRRLIAGTGTAELTRREQGTGCIDDAERANETQAPVEAVTRRDECTADEEGGDAKVPDGVEQSMRREECTADAEEGTGKQVPEGVEHSMRREECTSDADEGTGKEVFAASEADVDVELREAAAFVSCVVVRNKDTFECKGYCFLTFLTGDEALASMKQLNAGVQVAGCVLQAQLSKPKERKAPQVDPREHLSNLNIRRARYPAVGKRAQYGHFDPGLGQKSFDTTKDGHCGRNAAGRKTEEFSGTRGGNQLKELKRMEDLAGKRNTGFVCATTNRSH